MHATPQIRPLSLADEVGACETLVDLLDRAASGSRRGLHIPTPGGEIEHVSWSELRSRARAAAREIHAAGVRPEDRVAVLLPNDARFAAAFFGALQLGAVPVPLPPPDAGARLEALARRNAHVLADAKPRLALVPDEESAQALRATGVPARVLGAGAGANGRAVLPRRARPDDVAMIQYTSGSTRSPRGVPLTHANLVANVGAIAHALAWTPGDTGCSWLPLFHDMGLIGGLLVPLSVGADLHLLSPERFLLDPGAWLRTISGHRATISVAPNFAYAYCARRVRAEERARLDLRSWRAALCGGEAVDAAALDGFVAAFGPRGFRRDAFVPCFGLAEATLAVTMVDVDAAPRVVSVDAERIATEGRAVPAEEGARRRRIVSCGRPVRGVSVRVRRDDADVPEDVVGEIEVAGASVATVGAVGPDGWLRTGDLGFLRDGELYVVGRAKDLLVVRGRNYHPEDLEATLEAVEGVRRGSAVAVGERADGTDAVLAFVETRLDAPEELARLALALRAAARQELGLQLAEVVLCGPGALPKTSSGKRQRALARTLHRAGELGARHVLASPRRVPAVPAADAEVVR
jgi:acyl-CoA synthetase (AMP-forming)/AMP-acid ligase II